MAMANRMPVVTTPFHFALELVQDSRGIIVPYDDRNGTLFATALCALLGDAALREKMAGTKCPTRMPCMMLVQKINFTLQVFHPGCPA